MKKQIIFLSFFLALIFVFNTSKAQLLLVENFDYTAGDTLITRGWTQQGTTTTNPILINNNNLYYLGYPGSAIGKSARVFNTGQDVYKTFTAVNSGSIYFAALVNFESLFNVPVGDYFIHLGEATTTNFRGRVFARKDASNMISFGISKAGSAAATIGFTGYNYPANGTYLVVVEYQFITGSTTNDSVRLWINPVMGATKPTPDAICGDVTGNDATSLSGIYLRQGNSTNCPTAIVDGIRVASSWTDLFPQSHNIGWANLQWPGADTITVGDNYNVYGQAWIDGITNPAGQATGLNCWVGYSTSNTNPNTWTNWVNAPFNIQASNNDEFGANIGTIINTSGVYYYATRYQYLDGKQYFGGFSGTNGGEWNGTSNISGVLTVNDPPTIIVTPGAVNSLNYTEGSGPSNIDSFYVSGVSIADHITVALSSNFELSTTKSPFTAAASPITLNATSGVVDTKLYVRLKAGLSVNTYTDTIDLTSTGATTQQVVFNGEVSSLIVPIISVTPNTLSNFTYVYGSGPSTVQSFVVSGTNLTGDVNVVLPTKYEISVSNSPFTPATGNISFAHTAGTLADTTVYVRLKAGLAAGTQDETIQITSTSATDKTVACTGNVTPAPATQMVITNINPFSPYVNQQFAITFQTRDFEGTPTNVTSDLVVTLSDTSSNGTLTGDLVDTIYAGTNSVTFTGLSYDFVETVTIFASSSLTNISTNIAILEVPATPNVFFSEYLEGSSNNKAIEIYNGTGASLNLNGYVVKLGANGGAWGNTLTLPNKTIAAGDVYVIANSGAVSSILSKADTTSSVTFFNGDDALGLFYNGILIDVFGQYLTDPGTSWSVAGVTSATAEHTLVRKYPDVMIGDTSWTNQAGTNASNSQWVVFGQNDTNYLGWHGALPEDPTISISYPANGGTVPSTSINVTFIANNFVIGTDGYIEYTYDGGTTIQNHTTTDPIAISGLVDGTTYSLVLELVDNSGNSLLTPAKDTATFTVSVPTIVDVPNIATLRQQATGTTIYRLTGEAVITYQRNARHQKYIQDTTGGVLIDDNAGTITTVYNQYDGITGVTGTLTLYGGLLEFVPTADPGAATSTGNVIVPELVTISDLSNIQSYESELIKIENLTFVEIDTFRASFNYHVTDGIDTMVFRTAFSEADYIGDSLYHNPFNVTAFLIQYNGTPQIVARNYADFEFLSDPYLFIISPTQNQVIQIDSTVVTYEVGNFEVAAGGAGDGYIKYTVNNGAENSIYDYSSIPLTGLIDGTVYTVKMWLVDNNGNALTTPVEDSVSFTVDLVGLYDVKSEISVYPNPASDYITVKGDVASVELFNSLGQKMNVININNTITISNIPSGVYSMRIILNNGKIETKQIIKK